MNEVVESVVIALSASLSGVVGVINKQVKAVVLPASWTTADLTLSVSVDGGTTYADLYDSAGNEVVLPAAASRHIDLTGISLVGVTNLKFRSGTAGTPVTQAAARTLQLVLQLAG